MKEHRTKALRVTTPHSIDSNDLHLKYRCSDCEDAYSDDLLDMWQFDLAPSKSRPSSSTAVAKDSYFCHQHQQLQEQRRRCEQQHCIRCDGEGGDGIGIGIGTGTNFSSQTQCRIVTTDSDDGAAATFNASATALTFTKPDSFYRWFSYGFRGSDKHACEKTKEENEREGLKQEGGGGGGGGDDDDDDDDDELYESGSADRWFRRRFQFANTEERNSSENRETRRCRFTRCDPGVVKDEKFLSLSMSPTPWPSSSTSVSNSYRLYSVLDLVSGVDLSDNWLIKMEQIEEAIRREKNTARRKTSRWYNLRDAGGNTALLVSGQQLLKEGSFDKAVELAALLLKEGSDVNVSNNENRTLLSYSIQYMDKSIRLTVLLLNYGANVWPLGRGASSELPLPENRLIVDASHIDQDDALDGGSNSAFTWFLISIIKRLKLNDHCLRTLYLLAEVMGDQPELMHSHVMSTMFSHAKCYSILGPVFLQIKLAVSPYWTQPQSLKFLCKSVIRKSLFSVPGRFVTAENMSSLLLPPSLQSYVMLEH